MHTIRQLVATDASRTGEILNQAFAPLYEMRGLKSAFAERAACEAFVLKLHQTPDINGWVIEVDNEIVGCSFMDQRDQIKGIGPIAVDPKLQGHGYGRLLMQTMLDVLPARTTVGLLQDSFNVDSLSLYASLGFEVVAPVIQMRGTPMPPKTQRCERITSDKLAACNRLQRQLLGFDRQNDLMALQSKGEVIGLYDGKNLRAFCSSPTNYFSNFIVAHDVEEIVELLSGACAILQQPLSVIILLNQKRLFQECLKVGLKSYKAMHFMVHGKLPTAQGIYCPSVIY